MYQLSYYIKNFLDADGNQDLSEHKARFLAPHLGTTFEALFYGKEGGPTTPVAGPKTRSSSGANLKKIMDDRGITPNALAKLMSTGSAQRDEDELKIGSALDNGDVVPALAAKIAAALEIDVTQILGNEPASTPTVTPERTKRPYNRKAGKGVKPDRKPKEASTPAPTAAPHSNGQLTKPQPAASASGNGHVQLISVDDLNRVFLGPKREIMVTPDQNGNLHLMIKAVIRREELADLLFPSPAEAGKDE